MIVAAMAFAVFQPVTVRPRRNLAPGYAFVDDTGAAYTSETGRGDVTLYTFSPLGSTGGGDGGARCPSCGAIDETMAAVADAVAADPALAAIDVRLVTIALEPVDDDGEELAAAARASGADGERWRWIGTDDEAVLRVVVGEGFGRWFEDRPDGTIGFDPAYVIVDGNGIVRGVYDYRTLSSDADKLTSHLGILADEIAHIDGPAAVAYEAAHIFMCYP